MEHTFVMVKPDGVQRGLIGEVISRLEAKGLQLAACKMMRIDTDLARRHYAAHRDKPFYDGLITFITSGPVVAMVWQGDDAAAVVRRLLGSTDAREAAAGTIRGDFGLDVGHNLVHGSDSLESAEREIDLFFDDGERHTYEREIDAWVYQDK